MDEYNACMSAMRRTDELQRRNDKTDRVCLSTLPRGRDTTENGVPGDCLMDQPAQYTDDAENAPIATATRVPPDEFESDDDAENAPIATATRVP